ncbi:DEP domain-containing protein 4 [Neosynchiropus ocellatus]
MAVDLTPRFRRLNSQTRSLRENMLQGFSGPFGATQLWHNIIHALHTQVEVRRCRRHLRLHAETFPGCDAVDAVLSYLMQNVAFCSSEVSRLKAARLCQALMEAKVFEPVGTKLFRRDKDAAFEDSAGSLYRFLDYKGLQSEVHGASCDSKNMPSQQLEMKRPHRSRLIRYSQNQSSASFFPQLSNVHCVRLNELRTISNPLTVGPSDRKVERLLRTINLQPSQNQVPNETPFLPKPVVEEIWKQQTLLQLLQIVELPMLDCILTSPARVHLDAAPANQDLVISNTCLERELPEALQLSHLDEWLSAAAECLELFPDQLIVVASEQLHQCSAPDSSDEGKMSQKSVLFDLIAKHYGGQGRASFLSGRYLDIHVAILKLLGDGRVAAALTASQLCLRLLEPGVRDELRRLLAFMAAAAEPSACRLHKQTDNRAVVVRALQRAVLHDPDLTRSQCETLVRFLMDNHAKVFQVPASLTDAVQATLRAMQKGGDFDSITTFTFCQQVTPQEFEDRREAATLENLKQLLHHISSNNELPVKEKRRLLKEFEKHHPVVFLQHLSGSF